MDNLFANRTAHRDFLINELTRRDVQGCDVFIAVAFFTETNVVQQLLDQGCKVWLVIRLGFPTSPAAVEWAMSHPNVQLRVYTARSFHPKLYLFGDEKALVGSANLTRAAITTNQEIVVGLDDSDERLSELAAIFEDYWEGADVPTGEMLAKYKVLYHKYDQHSNAAELLAEEVAELLGKTAPNNIARGQPKPKSDSLFRSSFRKSYQECISAFNIVRDAYAASGYRKVSEQDVPLRLEVDSFMSFIRQKHATGESWQQSPYRTVEEQRTILRPLIDEWSSIPWPYFENTIVGETYPRLQRVFKSKETILAASDDELFDALSTLHSFGDRLRFYRGGKETWRNEFINSNDPERAREALAHLVFGRGDVVDRMADAVNGNGKIKAFGKANVQELIGWCNKEELPILNSRTAKVLRYLGSRVRQIH